MTRAFLLNLIKYIWKILLSYQCVVLTVAKNTFFRRFCLFSAFLSSPGGWLNKVFNITWFNLINISLVSCPDSCPLVFQSSFKRQGYILQVRIILPQKIRIPEINSKYHPWVIQQRERNSKLRNLLHVSQIRPESTIFSSQSIKDLWQCYNFSTVHFSLKKHKKILET